jgi:hypothetical protein
MVYGALRLGKERQREWLDEISLLTGDLTDVLPVTREVAHKYGEISDSLLEGEGSSASTIFGSARRHWPKACPS